MGTAAGAVGTVALNITTYADMALRGRPPSQLPAKVAGILAHDAGIDLSAGLGDTDAKLEHRKTGLGALLGFATGLGLGTAYGLLRPQLGTVPRPLASVGLGLTAMAASDLPSIALGATNPATWGFAGWAADIIPHLIYGLFTTMAYDTFTRR